MSWAAFQDFRDEIVFAGTMLLGAVAIGVAVGEHQAVARIRAEAECPAPGAYRRVMTIRTSGEIEVRCHYGRTH